MSLRRLSQVSGICQNNLCELQGGVASGGGSVGRKEAGAPRPIPDPKPNPRQEPQVQKDVSQRRRPGHFVSSRALGLPPLPSLQTSDVAIFVLKREPGSRQEGCAAESGNRLRTQASLGLRPLHAAALPSSGRRAWGAFSVSGEGLSKALGPSRD